MKGLLLKDFYMITKYCKTSFLIIAVFILAAVFDSSNSFFFIYTVILTATIPITIMSYDERCKGNFYCDCMPFSRKKAVASKYILMLLVISITIMLISIIQAATQIKNGTFEFQNYITLVIGVFAMTIIAQSIMLPIIFKFGVEKGRIAYYIITGTICGGVIAIHTIFKEEKIQFIFNQSYIAILIIVIIAAALFVLSLILSITFYKQREL